MIKLIISFDFLDLFLTMSAVIEKSQYLIARRKLLIRIILSWTSLIITLESSI